MKLIQVPTSQGSLDKNLGCEQAPQVICENKKSETVKVVPSNIEATDEAIYLKAKKVFSKKETAIFIGGDHAITYGLAKAFSEEFGNPSLIIFDAHADADVFFKPVSHQDLNRAMIEEKLIEKERLMIIGLRKIFEVEKPFLKKHKIKNISADEIHKNFEGAKEKLSKFLSEQKNIYLSIDIDALDPSIAPGTGYLEENGLTEKEFFELLEMILGSGKIRASDLVEMNPKLDEKEKTIKIGKKILEKLTSQL